MVGADPGVTVKDGVFLLVQSETCAIRLRRSTNLYNLRLATPTPLFSPTTCNNLWAPEIHFISNRWYLYYSLESGAGMRGYVAESNGTNVAGPYIDRGVIFNGYWNIDGNVFTAPNGNLYYTFSGMPGPAQDICIALMSSPTKLSGAPVVISEPTLPWEIIGTPPSVNEAPWGFTRDGKLFISYSASGCWTDDYSLGLLTFTGADPLDPAAWTKTGPVFSKVPTVYGPGHNSVILGSDGQWWNIYHGNSFANQGCGGGRQIRAQRINWDSSGAPIFGAPTPLNSVTPDDVNQLAASYPLDETTGSIAHEISCATTATLKGSPTWLNRGLHFNGATDYVDGGATVGNHVQFAATLMAWIKADAFADSVGLITKGTTNSPYALQLSADGSLHFIANRGPQLANNVTGAWNSSAKLLSNRWYHVAVTADSTNIQFFINGISDSRSSTTNLRFGVANESLTLGADLVGGAKYFTGSMRDARVYGRALDAAEIAAIVSQSALLTATQSTASEFTLTWPIEQLGWRLLQTTDPSTATSWQPIPDSAGTNQFTIPISADSPAAFYKLIYP